MLRKIRTLFALLFFIAITLLFLDFTGTIRLWFDWMAKVQLIPAILALNAGIVVFLFLLTLVFGRLYCSVICPLGVFQDVISRFSKMFKPKRIYGYKRPLTKLRYTFLGIFVILIVAGLLSVASLLEPYSTYGIIVANIFSPIYNYVNNLFAFLAERAESYTFYSVDIWVKAGVSLAFAIISLGVVVVLSWKYGRLYCNSICPVGSILGLISRFSILKLRIDSNKCNACGLCALRCKSQCINNREHKVDYSRCVVCFDCLDNCKQKAISYTFRKFKGKQKNDTPIDSSKRNFIKTAAAMAMLAPEAAQNSANNVIAALERKKSYERITPITPPGSKSAAYFNQHCTACQLCIQSCPNHVLKPATSEYGIGGLMQPIMTYERGFCRSNCNVCSQVCPTGAISPITLEEKSSTQLGHAVVIVENCVAVTDGVSCGNCYRHCPVGAIIMVRKDRVLIPSVDTEKCIGCGACEYVCPARPFAAIHVEGHEIHRVL